MLSELALQDLRSADRVVFATQKLETHRLVQSALDALASVEHEVVPPSDTRRTKRSLGGPKTSSEPVRHGQPKRGASSPPESPQQLVKRLQLVAEQLMALQPREAKKAWALATEVRHIRDGFGRFGSQRGG